MRIERVRLIEIRLPLREPFRISTGEVRDRRILLLELTDADGIRAWSECVAGEQPNYSPETADTAWHAIECWLAPRVLGTSVESAADVSPVLNRGVRGHRMAKAALEMAIYALEAERRGVSLASLLGGTRDRIDVGVSIGIEESQHAIVEKVVAAVAAGYRKIKLKIEPGRDLDHVRAVREAVGPDVPLMVDANSAYSPADADRLAALDVLGLLMIEQPLDAEDLLRHADLQRRLRTPLCLDESITSLDRAEDMVRLGAGRIINIKPGRVGGFGESLAIHDFCVGHDVPVWCGGMLESGIGRAFNVALASLPGFTVPGDISPGSRYWDRDVVEPAWTMQDGRIEVPLDRPGIGVRVDMDRIEDLTVRSVEVVA